MSKHYVGAILGGLVVLWLAVCAPSVPEILAQHSPSWSVNPVGGGPVISPMPSAPAVAPATPLLPPPTFAPAAYPALATPTLPSPTPVSLLGGSGWAGGGGSAAAGLAGGSGADSG